MRRLANGTQVTSLPEMPPAVGTPGYGTDGNVGAGQEASIFGAAEYNAIQEEIIACILQSGQVPDGTDLAQLWKAMLWIVASKCRQRLTADLHIYVSPTGSDSNAGTSTAPFATLQYAWDRLCAAYDLNGYAATIHLADGTYAGVHLGALPLGGASDQSSIRIVGNTANPQAVIIDGGVNPAVMVDSGAHLQIGSLKIQAASNNGISVNAGSVGVGQLIFGTCGPSAAHLAVSSPLGGIYAVDNYTIVGGASAHMTATLNGLISIQGVDVTLTGTPSFTAFAFAASGAVINVSSNTYAGGATGQRYSAASNAVIVTGSGGAAGYLPGSVAGSTATGGQYT